MKNKLFATLLLSISLYNISFAQADITENDKSKSKNVVSFQPFALFVSGLELSYERYLGGSASLKFAFGYYSSDAPNSYIKNRVSTLDGFKGEIQIRKYVSNSEATMFKGYFAPYFQYRQISLKDYEYENTFGFSTKKDVLAKACNAGVGLGVQFLIGNTITTDIFVGGGLVVPTGDEDDNRKAHIDIVNPYKRGVVPRFNLNLGIPF